MLGLRVAVFSKIAPKKSIVPATDENRDVLQDATARVNSIQPRQKRVPKNPFTMRQMKKTDRFDRIGSADDPQDAYEYDLEIYRFLRKAEHERLPSPTLLESQSTITPNMRSMVIDWIVNIHSSGRLHSETLHLTVNIMDRYLSTTDLPKSDFQKLACAAIFIAAKNCEAYPLVPEDLVDVAGHSFTLKSLLRMETDVLVAIDYRVDTILPIVFIKRFLRISARDSIVAMLAHFMSEIALLDAHFIGMVPSKLAAAIVLLALTLKYEDYKWDKFMEDNTGYTVSDLSPVVQMLLDAIHTIRNSRFQQSFKKYGRISGKVSHMNFPKTIILK